MCGDMLVSVYIPTKNRLSLLQRALSSVANQTYPNIEIIVADDGSTDGTHTFLQKLLEGRSQSGKLSSFVEDDRIQVILSNESKGACHARNQAIAHAKGFYITGLDDDDELLPEHIQMLSAAYEEREVSCVASSHIMRYSEGDCKTQFGVGKLSLDALLHSNLIGNQVFTETEYLRAIGGFDESMVALQDYDTWIRLISKYGPGYKTRQATYILYTEHADRISAKLERKLAGWQKLQEKHGKLMNPKQVQSQYMIRLWMSDSKPGVFEPLQYLHKDNWRTALTIYFGFFPKPLQRIVGRLLKNRLTRDKAPTE